MAEKADKSEKTPDQGGDSPSLESIIELAQNHEELLILLGVIAENRIKARIQTIYEDYQYVTIKSQGTQECDSEIKFPFDLDYLGAHRIWSITFRKEGDKWKVIFSDETFSDNTTGHNETNPQFNNFLN